MSRNQFLHPEEVVRTVQKVLRFRTNDVHLIDDTSQSVLCSFWEYEQEHEIVNPEGFVKTVAIRKYRSWMRKRKPVAWRDAFEAESSQEDPARMTEKIESTSVLLALVDGMPLPFRDIIRLHLDGWTLERIAKEKKRSVNTIKTWFRRGKAYLKRAGTAYFLN